MSTALAPPVTRDTGRLKRLGAAAGQKYALIVVFAAIVGLFSLLNPDIFPTVANAQTIASTQATVALLALAAMLPLVVGQFDISVGYQFGLAQGLCAHLIINEGVPAVAAILVTLAAGLLIGLVNGVLVAKVKLNSFVATLGVGILVLGLTQWLTKDVTITGALPALLHRPRPQCGARRPAAVRLRPRRFRRAVGRARVHAVGPRVLRDRRQRARRAARRRAHRAAHRPGLRLRRAAGGAVGRA